ncbi:MAG TPA: group III truncated hemoglobin, partial [Candidatus Limnocylindria bacterium]|nr:group III truncated hemoglobin [Candidatus Limnocylindria bacterium]
QDAVLGPVFAAHVDDWTSHIATVTDFWSTQSGGPRLYRGGMGRHIRLGLQPEHFSHWLALWQTTAQSRFPTELANEVVGLARLIAERLKEMVAGVPILKVG